MGIAYKYSYVMSLLKRYGFRGLILKTKERATSPMLRYSTEYKKYLPTEEELKEQRKAYETLKYKPLISIVVPTYETPEKYLRELIETVLNQTYSNFELVLADGSSSQVVEDIAASYNDSRICYHRLSSNEGISGNTNQGFSYAKGDFIALIDHDDIITYNALFEMVAMLTSMSGKDRELALIYSDEDKISGEPYTYSRPHFKPDFNKEFIKRNNYFCHFLMFSKAFVEKTGGLRNDFDGAQDYDFVLRCLKEGAVVRHVPKILYHWRIHEGSTAGHSENKAYAFDAGCRAIESYLASIGESGHASTTSNLGVYHVEYDADLYDESEVILVKGENVISIDDGAKEKLGLLLHGDVIAVAPRLIDKKNHVISVGLTYDKDGNVANLCSGIHSLYKGYFLHGFIPKDVSAIKSDVMLWKKDAYDKYLEIRDELMKAGLSGDYLDVASCLLMKRYGRFVIDPEVTAVVLNKTLSSDMSRQKELLISKCGEIMGDYDPSYSPALTVKENETYSMKL